MNLNKKAVEHLSTAFFIFIRIMSNDILTRSAKAT